MSKRLLPLALLVLPACNALVCDFDRGLDDGIVRGRAVIGEGESAEAAPFASVHFLNAGLVRQADAEGAFTARDMPLGPSFVKIAADVDGDGRVDHGRLATVQLELAAHASGYFGAGGLQKTGVDLGDVPLTPLSTVRVTVAVTSDDAPAPTTPAARGLRAAVAVFRSGCLPPEAGSRLEVSCEDGDEDGSDHTLPLEGFALADDDGEAVIDGIVPGEVRVLLVLAPATGGAFPVVSSAARVATVVVDGDATDTGTLEIDLDEGEGTQEVLLQTTATESASGYLVLAPRGTPAPSCQASAPTLESPFVVVDGLADGPAHQLALPVGIFDIHLCPDDDAPASLFGAAVAADDGVLLMGPLFVGASLDCVGEVDGAVARDCDGDGEKGLPPLVPGSSAFEADRATWLACADACTDGSFDAPDTFGVRLVASCDVPGGPFDCDDDADLQPDVTEPPSCYGPLLGTDHDGDGQCSTEDPLPRCAGNVDCDDDDFPPGVASIVIGDGGLCDAFVDEPALDDEACAVRGTGLSRCAAFTMRCYARGCFADAECGGDAVCRAVDDDIRCRATCTTTPDSCGAGSTCFDAGAGGLYCVPDAAPAPLLRCYCEDALVFDEEVPSFVVEAAAAGACPDDETALWAACVSAWQDAGSL